MRELSEITSRSAVGVFNLWWWYPKMLPVANVVKKCQKLGNLICESSQIFCLLLKRNPLTFYKFITG